MCGITTNISVHGCTVIVVNKNSTINFYSGYFIKMFKYRSDYIAKIRQQCVQMLFLRIFY